MKTIKELEDMEWIEIEENRKMCNNWYEEGREDMKKDVIKLMKELEGSQPEVAWEELKKRIEGKENERI